MRFEKEWLQNLLAEETEIGEIIEDTIIENDRWSILHNIVFKVQDQFYTKTYRVGATEMQSESPFEYDDNLIECPEVFKVQKTIFVYKSRKEIDDGS